MFEHLEAGHDVEFSRALRGELLCRGLQVVDGDTRFNLVQACDRQRSFGHVDAGHGRAGFGHRLGQYAAAAAHVDDPPSRYPGTLADPVETQRIDLVQRPEVSLRIPPARRKRIELGDLRFIDVVVKWC